jgi:hypothetical protein
MSSLFFVQSDLAIASLVLACAICQVFEGNLLCICSLYVQQYNITENIINNILNKGKLVVVFVFQKPYYKA